MVAIYLFLIIKDRKFLFKKLNFDERINEEGIKGL